MSYKLNFKGVGSAVRGGGGGGGGGGGYGGGGGGGGGGYGGGGGRRGGGGGYGWKKKRGGGGGGGGGSGPKQVAKQVKRIITDAHAHGQGVRYIADETRAMMQRNGGARMNGNALKDLIIFIIRASGAIEAVSMCT